MKNPVPVRAFYDRDSAHEAVLRNLLQRQGYEDLAAVRTEGRKKGREEGREEGVAESIVMLLEGRGLQVDQTIRQRLFTCRDLETLRSWLLAAAKVEDAGDLFD